MKLLYRATAEADRTFTPSAGKYNAVTVHQEIWFEVEANDLVEATTKAQEILESFDDDLSLVEVTELNTIIDVQEDQ